MRTRLGSPPRMGNHKHNNGAVSLHDYAFICSDPELQLSRRGLNQTNMPNPNISSQRVGGPGNAVGRISVISPVIW